MKRPLFLILNCLILGVLLESRWSIVEHIAARRLTIIGYGFLLCFWYGLYRYNHARLATLALGLIALAAGMTRYAATNQLPTRHIAHFVTDELVTIEGFLAQPPETGIYVAPNGFEKRRYLYLETTWLEQWSRRTRVCGKVRITLGESPAPQIMAKTFVYGDVLRTRLQLHQPQNLAEMGDFDYRAYLQRQGIYLVGFLHHDRQIIKLPEKQGNWVLGWIYCVQAKILRFFDNFVPGDAQTVLNPTFEAIQVMKAITIGTGYELSPLVQAHFRQSGLYHLLVVSGVNVGILIWVLHQLLRVLQIPLRQGNILLPAALFLYAGLTGFQFPVLRATLMALTIYLALTCSRLAEPLYSLAFACGLILLLFPNALSDVSFQLTIAATGFILLLLGFVRQFAWWQRLFTQEDHQDEQRRTMLTVLWRYLLQAAVLTMLMTTGAMIGVSPLLAFYFQRVYPYSFISNLLAAPIIGLLLPLSLLLSLFCFLPETVVAPLFFVNILLTKTLMFVAALFSGSDVVIPRPPVYSLVIYYLFVVGGLLYYRRNGTIEGKEMAKTDARSPFDPAQGDRLC